MNDELIKYLSGLIETWQGTSRRSDSVVDKDTKKYYHMTGYAGGVREAVEQAHKIWGKPHEIFDDFVLRVKESKTDENNLRPWSRRHDDLPTG